MRISDWSSGVCSSDLHPAPAELPKARGNFQGEYASSALSVDVSYSTPVEHHNPMEPHASTVLYQPDGSLHIHDKTQGTQHCQAYVQQVFGLEKDHELGRASCRERVCNYV